MTTSTSVKVTQSELTESIVAVAAHFITNLSQRTMYLIPLEFGKYRFKTLLIQKKSEDKTAVLLFILSEYNEHYLSIASVQTDGLLEEINYAPGKDDTLTVITPDGDELIKIKLENDLWVNITKYSDQPSQDHAVRHGYQQPWMPPHGYHQPQMPPHGYNQPMSYQQSQITNLNLKSLECKPEEVINFMSMIGLQLVFKEDNKLVFNNARQPGFFTQPFQPTAEPRNIVITFD